MNRIILIGNGFDLAHKLDTRYCDFLDYLWGNIINGLKEKIDINNSKYEDEDKLLSLELKSQSFLFFFQDLELSKYTDIKIAITRDQNRDRYKCSPELNFNNNFFESLTNEFSCGNWVDIETFYYEELKNDKNDQEKIKKLNSDFKQIKELLEEYLSKIDIEKQDRIDDLYSDIYSRIRLEDLSVKGRNIFIETLIERIDKLINDKKEQERCISLSSSKGDIYPNAEDIGFIKNHLKLDGDITSFINYQFSPNNSIMRFFAYPDNILFLTFNYTGMEGKYLKRGYSPKCSTDMLPQVNHIHG